MHSSKIFFAFAVLCGLLLEASASTTTPPATSSHNSQHHSQEYLRKRHLPTKQQQLKQKEQKRHHYVDSGDALGRNDRHFESGRTKQRVPVFVGNDNGKKWQNAVVSRLHKPTKGEETTTIALKKNTKKKSHEKLPHDDHGMNLIKTQPSDFNVLSENETVA